MRFIVSILILIASTLFAQAEERVALVIANGAYSRPAALPSALPSAALVAATLRRLGFAVDERSDVSAAALEEALVELERKADGASVALLYFAGYAFQRDGVNRLLPVDGNAASSTLLADAMARLSGATTRIVLIDAWSTDRPEIVGENPPRGLREITPDPGAFVAFAAAPNTIAADPTGAASPFAEAFARAALVPEQPLEELGKAIRNDVVKATVAAQFPWYANAVDGSFTLLPEGGVAPAEPVVSAPAPAKPAQPSGGGDPAQEATFWEIAKSFDTAAMYEDYLNRYPDGAHAADAQTRLLSLELGPNGTLSGGLASAAPDAETPVVAPPLIVEVPAEPIGKGAPGGGFAGAPAEEPAAVEPTAPASGGATTSPDDTYWEIARSFDTIAVYQDYLTRYPDGSHSAEARARIGGLGGTSVGGGAPAMSAGVTVPEASPPGLGGGTSLESAAPSTEPSLPALPAPVQNDEFRDWLMAESQNTVSSYQTFLSLHPNGAYAKLAGERVADMTDVMAKPEPEDGPPLMSGGSLGSAMPGSAAPEPTATEPPLPEPSIAPPMQVADEVIVRHPTIDAPDKMAAGQTMTISIALTEARETPEVTAKAAPGQTLTAEGALQLALPANVEEWQIDIDLLATGFDLVDGGKWSRPVTLYRVGDSDFVRFDVKARSVGDTSKDRKLMARLYHDGRFLGSASRPITVYPNREALEAADAPGPVTMLMAAPGTQDLATDLLIGEHVEVADLDVTIHYDDPDNLGKGLIILHSPHIGAPVSAEFTTPAGMDEWLTTEYQRLVKLGLNLRGGASLKKKAKNSDKAFLTKVAEGFGSDLYRNYVPDEFKTVFATLRDEGKLHSIQITSNSPALPWELVRPDKKSGGGSDGFLGIDYRLARWAPRESGGQIDRPLNTMAFSGVATVAPAYDGNRELPFQQIEVDALSKLAGFRLIDGDFSSFERMIGEVSTGFIHFSGHGALNAPGTGEPVFAIRLLDQELDPTTWRALRFAPHENGNPFYFFNACDSGHAASLGGFVQGWGPAVLASGASGFIGGMWPLSDRTAAAFSTGFYSGITTDLATGPVYVAEVLRDVRRKFYETGDPTYLAYTFYGNANLQVVAK